MAYLGQVRELIMDLPFFVMIPVILLGFWRYRFIYRQV
jgi:hypothetical protein